MISFVLSIYGLVSAAIGILMSLPDKIAALRAIQIGVNEVAPFPALLGVIAAVGGLMKRPRSWLAILSGIIGAGLTIRPLLAYRAAANDMHSAMRAGLGRDYEAQIRPAAKARLPQATWSLRNVMGGIQQAAETQRLDDVVYVTRDGQDLKLNIYQPMEPDENSPAIIVIHGGGWRNGEPGGWFAPHNRYFASQGYTVFDVEYRLSGVAKWPAQLDDVQSAIEWVKAHAGDYHVDPQRIALLGRSAGAHLALMAAYCGQHTIRSVVSLYGPTEMRWPDLEPDSAIKALMGGTFEELPQAYENATPLNFVRDGLPPTLIIEGGMDTVVPFHHGDALVGRLSLTDSVFVLLRVPWSRHGFDAVRSGLGAQLTYYHLDRFLAWSLYEKS